METREAKGGDTRSHDKLRRHGVLWTLIGSIVFMLASCSGGGVNDVVMGSGGATTESGGSSNGGGADSGGANRQGQPGDPCGAGQPECSEELSCVAESCQAVIGGEIGKPCSRNGDCDSSVCLPVGDGRNVCTASCNAPGDCGPGWSCAALLGQESNICQCSASPETCNGQDDDCNGIIDDAQVTRPECTALNEDYICRGSQCECRDLTCGGACVDGQSNPAHCGACGNACPGGAECVAGECHCSSSTERVCDGGCRDLTTDIENCGSCGNTCPTGAACVKGECVCSGGSPRICGGVDGGARCTDVSRDNRNCGSCGTTCKPGAGCSNGVCECGFAGTGPGADGLLVPPFSSPMWQDCGSACFDTANDRDNCGTCGNPCPSAQVCREGSCVTCPAASEACGDWCVDTQNDEWNCGGCGNRCIAGGAADGTTCVDGQCKCPGVMGIACDGVCRDVSQDAAHCGECGNACPGGYFCNDGTCD